MPCLERRVVFRTERLPPACSIRSLSIQPVTSAMISVVFAFFSLCCLQTMRQTRRTHSFSTLFPLSLSASFFPLLHALSALSPFFCHAAYSSHATASHPGMPHTVHHSARTNTLILQYGTFLHTARQYSVIHHTVSPVQLYRTPVQYSS